MFNGPLIESGKSCQFIVVLSLLNFICLTAQGQSIYVSAAGGIIATCAGSPSEDPFLHRFTFSAAGLNGPVLVEAPVGFEVSLSQVAGYANLVTVSAQAGTIVATPIFVRASSSPTPGIISGLVTLSSAGAVTRNVPVTGNISSQPTLNPVADKVYNDGDVTEAIVFSSVQGGATYSWTNSTPSIGLPASGQGNIPSFTATNPGISPTVATITAIPLATSLAFVPIAPDRIDVVNTITKETVTSITVGADPYGVSVSPGGDKVFVTNSGSDDVSVISTSTYEVIGTIAVGDSPSGIVVSPDGSKVYVVNTFSGSVSVIDASSQTLITTISVAALLPEAVAINADGTKLYVIGGDKMSVVSTSTDTEIASMFLGSVLTSLKAVAVNSLTGRIYVVDGGIGMNVVYVIDPVLHSVVGTIHPGQNPAGIAISPDGKTGYVSARDSRQVAFVDLTTNEVIAPVSVPSSPVSLAISPDGMWLYAVSEIGGVIHRINTVTRTIGGTIAVSTSLFGNFISGGIGCAGEKETFTITVSPTPTVTASPVKGVITACEGSPSVSPQLQQFSISAVAILSNVLLDAPVNFEISTMPGSGYASTIILNPTAGAIAETVIYVRSAPGVAAQAISGNISITTLNAPPRWVGVKGVVYAPPILDPVPDLSYTMDSLTEDIIFSGTANTFHWTNDNSAIGLPETGSGHIASFIAAGAENLPIEATIQVTSSSHSYAYVTHEGSGASDRMVLVLDLQTNTIVDTISLDFYPSAILVSADKKWVYVTASTSRYLAVIDTHTNTIDKTIDLVGLGVDMVLSPDGDKLYVAQRIPDRVSVFKTSSNALERTITSPTEPRAIEINADGTKLYITTMNSLPGGVFAIDEATGQSKPGISDIGSSGPGDMVKNSDGSRLYICNSESNSVTVANTITNTVVTRVPVSRPSALTISPDDQTVYVASLQSDIVAVIDAATNTVVKTVPVGQQPQGLEVSADGRFLYVVNYSSGTLSVISTATQTIASTIPMGYRPSSRGKFIVNGTGCEGSVYSFKIKIHPVPPTIRVTKASGTVEICYGAPAETSVPREFSVSGLKLISPVTIDAPNHLELSTEPGGTYSRQLTLSPVSGVLEPLKVYVRATASAPEGVTTDDVVLTASGADTKSVSVIAIAHSLPTLDGLDDLSFVSGSETGLIPFSGTGTTLDFIWSNNTTAIGLPATGRGSIPSFTAVNTGSAPITATIEVAPKSVSMAFISNGSSDDVSVVNTDTKQEVSRVPVSDFPTVLAITPGGDKVYVANCIEGKVSVISTKDYSVVGTIQVGPFANGILMNNSGTLVYVYSDEDGSTSIIDTQTDRVVKTIADGSRAMVISPDDKYLYILRSYGSGSSLQIIKLDALTLQVITFANIDKSSPSGMAIAISPAGDFLYVINAKESVPRNPVFPTEDYIAVIDSKTLSIEKSISVWQVNANNLQLSPDGALLYTMNIRGELLTISTLSNSIISEIPTAGEALPFGIHNNQAYLVNSSYNTNDPTAPAGNLRIVDVANGSELAKIFLGESPGVLGNFISRSTGCTGEDQSFTITVYPEDYSLPQIQASEAIGSILNCEGVESINPNIQQFTISASHLNAPILLSAPENFEVSLSTHSDFAATLSIDHSNGAVPNTIVYVRSRANARAGLIQGKVIVASAGANTREVFVHGSVSAIYLQPVALPPATIDQPYSYTLPGNFNGLSITATGLPEGLTINDRGIISGTAVQLTTSASDFTVTATNGICTQTETFSISIEKVSVSVFVPNVDLVYDGKPKSVSSLIKPSGSNLAVTYNGSTDLPVRAGTYTVVATLNDGYFQGTGTGTLTIAKASVIARADNASRAYGVGNPPLKIVYSNLVNNETPDEIDVQPIASTIANTSSDVGNYSITLTGGEDDNYSLTLEDGLLTIFQTDQALTFDNIDDKIATDKPFALSASSSAGLSVVFSVVSGPAKVSGNMMFLSGGAGTVVVRASQSGNTNFKSVTAQRSFAVSQVEQVVTLESIDNKLVTDDPFSISALSSEGLPITLSIASGPATISGNIISLAGGAGLVIVQALQAGTNSIKPAAAETSFFVSLLDQTLTFEDIGDKLATDIPFAITASSSAGLPIVFTIISGPATITGNIVSLTGEAGIVIVRASQDGTASIRPAAIETSFRVDLVVATEPDNLDYITAYPQPVNRLLVVENAAGIKAEGIGLLDGLGRTVDLAIEQVNDIRVELNTGEIPAGLYYVRIKSAGKDRFIKISVIH